MNIRLLILWMCLVLFGAASLLAEAPKLSEAEVIRLASEAAKKNGYDLTKYEPPKASYSDSTRKSDSWWVYYQLKVRAPGGHFFVNLHDKTKETEVFPGY